MDIKIHPHQLSRLMDTRIFIRPIKPLAEAVAPMAVAIIDIFEKIFNPTRKMLGCDTSVVFLREQAIEEEKDINGIVLTCRHVSIYRLDKAKKRRTTEVRLTYYLSENYCWIGNRPHN